MELKGSKTEKNLLVAFSGESEARNKYTYFASQAKKDGYEQISEIFKTTAKNEREHAKIWFKLLNNGIPKTLDCLKIAAKGEEYEATTMYPQFAKEAKEEGFDQIAQLFERVAKIEQEHKKRFEILQKNIEEDIVFKRDEECYWICRNCGYVHIGKEPPEVCPVCYRPKAYFELCINNY